MLPVIVNFLSGLFSLWITLASCCHCLNLDPVKLGRELIIDSKFVSHTCKVADEWYAFTHGYIIAEHTSVRQITYSRNTCVHTRIYMCMYMRVGHGMLRCHASNCACMTAHLYTCRIMVLDGSGVSESEEDNVNEGREDGVSATGPSGLGREHTDTYVNTVTFGFKMERDLSLACTYVHV